MADTLAPVVVKTTDFRYLHDLASSQPSYGSYPKFPCEIAAMHRRG
jgi:hypothetical protein